MKNERFRIGSAYDRLCAERIISVPYPTINLLVGADIIRPKAYYS